MENQISEEKFLALLNAVAQKKKESDSNPDVIEDAYNFFRFLGLGHDELVFSRMIAHLLNPKGSHKCGDTFIRLFFEKLAAEIEGIPEPGNLDYKKARIETEKDIGPVKYKEYTGGRIDIFITIPDLNNKLWSFIIENKIHADDQPSQLERYRNYISAVNPGNFFILYLTLHGTAPSEDSVRVSAEDMEENPDLIYWNDISYEFFISNWIEKSLEEVKTENYRLQDILKQFLSQVRRLTGHELRKEQEMEIQDLISRKENLEAARLLVENYNSLRRSKIEEAENLVKMTYSNFKDLSLTGEKGKKGEDGRCLTYCKKESWKYLRIDIFFGKSDYDFKINITYQKNVKEENIRGRIRTIFNEQLLPDWNAESKLSACRKVYKNFEDWINQNEDIKKHLLTAVEKCDEFEKESKQYIL